MSEWISCPKCGALMIGITSGQICPLCGYRLPAETITTTTGTSAEYVPLVRCKDCIHYDGYYCHNQWWGDGHGNYTPPIKQEEGFCDWAERKEE